MRLHGFTLSHAAKNAPDVHHPASDAPQTHHPRTAACPKNGTKKAPAGLARGGVPGTPSSDGPLTDCALGASAAATYDAGRRNPLEPTRRATRYRQGADALYASEARSFWRRSRILQGRGKGKWVKASTRAFHRKQSRTSYLGRRHLLHQHP